MTKYLFKFSLFLLPVTLQGQEKKQCLYFSSYSHTLPLQNVTGTNAQKRIVDTFYIYNGCKDAVRIAGLSGGSAANFKINEILPSQKETPLCFEAIIYNRGEDFRNETFGVTLDLEDKSQVSFYITIPTIGNNSKIFLTPDGRIDYTIAQHPDTRFTLAFLTHPDGSLRAKGLVQDGDTSIKTGNWEYYTTGKWQIDMVAHSKELSLSAFNQKLLAGEYDGKPFSFKIKVRENNTWKEPVSEWGNAGLRFFYTPATDSVVAYTDSSSWCFPVDFKKMNTFETRQFYLLKPGEPVMKIGMYTVPFQTVKNSYALLLNPTNLSRSKTYEAVYDSFYNAFQKQYPQLIPLYITEMQKGFSTEKLTTQQKAKLLAALDKNSMVRNVSQLFTLTDLPQSTYCNNQVRVTLKRDMTDDFRQAMLSLGFTQLYADGYSQYNWMLTYKSKVVDDTFFALFRKITEHPMVNYAHFNMYIQAVPDGWLRDKHKD